MLRLLLAEDDLIAGRALARMLSREVDVVDVVADAATALRRLELDAVDALVTNYYLRDVGGIALAAEVRRRWPCVPVVLLSGRVDDATRAEAQRVGIGACFGKPLGDPGELVSLLRALVDEVKG